MAKSHNEYGIRYIRAEKKARRLFGENCPDLKKRIHEILEQQTRERRIKNDERKLRLFF